MKQNKEIKRLLCFEQPFNERRGTVKKYIISFGVTLGTIALLFFIGNTFHISLLSVQWLYVNEPENFQMEAKGGLIPVAVGLILGFITDYVLSEKEKKQRHQL